MIRKKWHAIHQVDGEINATLITYERKYYTSGIYKLDPLLKHLLREFEHRLHGPIWLL